MYMYVHVLYMYILKYNVKKEKRKKEDIHEHMSTSQHEILLYNNSLNGLEIFISVKNEFYLPTYILA